VIIVIYDSPVHDLSEVSKLPKPESALPTVEVYTKKSAEGHMEAVLCFRYFIEPTRAVAALQQSAAYDRRKGERQPAVIFRDNYVVLVDTHDTLSPARLLARAKGVAERLEHTPKVVAPPQPPPPRRPRS
jgi:hypothetical protein